MQSKRKPAFQTPYQAEQRRRRFIRNWIILLSLALAAFIGVQALSRMGRGTEITALTMPCYSDQDIKIFGNNVLYYDGASIHCVHDTGRVLWSFPVGPDAEFAVSDTHFVAWAGSTLYIVDQNGHPTYNENLGSEIQFARISDRFAAAVVGDDTHPTLMVKDINGAQMDTETEAYNGKLLLDVGFYGDQSQYMWTLAMDVYGTAVNTIMNTFELNKMNTGIVSLGDNLAYAVLFENGSLRVFTTQQMYTYDYKGVQDVARTMLVYGWRLIDTAFTNRGNAYMLLTPVGSMDTGDTMTELRVLYGEIDRRLTLPTTCVGAGLSGSTLYAVSPEYLYRCNIDTQQFYGYKIPLPNNLTASSLIGLTKSGRAIVTAGEFVYSVTLPK